MSSAAQLPVESFEGFRISPQQRKLWRLMERHPYAAFAAQCRVRITGPLNMEKFDKAILLIRRTHEILRTRFVLLPDTRFPVQVIAEEFKGLDQQCELSHQSAAEVKSEVDSIAEALWKQAQTANEDPKINFTVVHVKDGEHFLLATSSGLCADAPALAAIVRELHAAYSGISLRQDEALQYADISEWQNQILEDAKDHDSYWKTPGFSSLRFPHLPFERRNPRAAEFTSGVLARHVPGNIALSQAEAVLIAAFQFLISRICSTDRFLTGVRVNGRTPAELRDAIGLFEKSLPIAATVDPDQDFAALVQTVSRTLELATYDQAYFDAETFAPDESRQCQIPFVFGVRSLFALQEVESTKWEVISSEDCLDCFELAVTATISNGVLRMVKFAWDKSIFDEQEIVFLADLYIELLQQVVSDPSRRLGKFNLGPDAVSPLLTAKPIEQSAPNGVHAWIEEQCIRVPQRIAAIQGDQKITYSELNQRASRLAWQLRKLSVAPDTIVAIVAQRSINFIVAIFAVLKSGAAWLPIEPDIPAERINYMIARAGAVAVIEDGVKHDFQKLGIPAIAIDEEFGEDAYAGPLFPSIPAIFPEQLAYVIFTSGSTGQPKGVAIEHRHLRAYLLGLKAEIGFPDGAGYALVSTMAADLGITPVFAALTSGGCLHLVPSSQSGDVAALGAYFLQTAVHYIKIVPAHLQALCQSLSEGTKFSWRAVIVGGEPLTWELTQLVKQFAPDSAIINEYGPTETTVGVISSCMALDEERFNTTEMPIGHPRAGVSAYVLDQSLRPVSAWTTGDLYIGGNCVGRGYIHSGDLTAERFLPDPFQSTQGTRMYATGDRARYRSDGSLEFLGRNDGQIKLRGYRIELSEIEATLCRHPHVQAAIAMVISDKSGGKLLAAWVAVGQAKVMHQELRDFVSESLPSYMIPNVFTCVDRFKLTPNGKVDRHSLPPVADQSSGTTSVPLDEVEEGLLAIWRKVLGKENAGVDDNYFALGGDSLRVVQVVHELRRYGITVRAMDILRHPTIRGLRKALRQERRCELFPNGVPQVSIQVPEEISVLMPDVDDCYPISGIQNFVLDTYAKNQGVDGIYHIQECFHLEDPGFSLEALKSAFEAVLQRHPALRTVFYLKTSLLLQCVRKALSWNINVKDISSLDGPAQDTYIAEEIQNDRSNLFDTANIDAPLFRISVFLRSATKFSLFFVCHHAIMDGWGHQIFLNHLVEAYTAIKSGKAPDLGESDDTYRQFVMFERALSASEQVSQFWHSYLSGVRFPSLPDFVSPDVQETDEPIVVAEFSPEQNEAWERVARENSVSMQALLLAVWLEVLRDWSQESVATSGVISNGRSEYLTDPLSTVGLFWNVVPIVSHARVPLLQQAVVVQKDLIDIQPYASYPLPQLIADHGGQELFYSAFRYLNFWNMKQIPEQSGLRFLGAQFVDRYPFAMTFTTGVSAAGRYIQIEYASKAISRKMVKKLLESYQSLLAGLTQAVPASPETLVAARPLTG
jgi:amino acid adenylation domain-containing protein